MPMVVVVETTIVREHGRTVRWAGYVCSVVAHAFGDPSVQRHG